MDIDKVLTIHDGFIINKTNQDYVDEFLNSLESLKGFKIDKKSI